VACASMIDIVPQGIVTRDSSDRWGVG